MCMCNFACNGHPQNDLCCVGWDVNPYSLTSLLTWNKVFILLYQLVECTNLCTCAIVFIQVSCTCVIALSKRQLDFTVDYSISTYQSFCLRSCDLCTPAWLSDSYQLIVLPPGWTELTSAQVTSAHVNPPGAGDERHSGRRLRWRREQVDNTCIADCFHAPTDSLTNW